MATWRSFVMRTFLVHAAAHLFADGELAGACVIYGTYTR